MSHRSLRKNDVMTPPEAPDPRCRHSALACVEWLLNIGTLAPAPEGGSLGRRTPVADIWQAQRIDPPRRRFVARPVAGRLSQRLSIKPTWVRAPATWLFA